MPDPYKNVQPGDPLEVSASAWNRVIEAGKAIAEGKLSFASAPSATSRSQTIVKVKNETGNALPRNSILGLHGPIFTPSATSVNVFLRDIAFRGWTPDVSRHNRRYVVTIDPAPVDGFARACIAGVCQAKVDIIDESHEYAIIQQDRFENLRSSRHGHARIIWREGEEDAGYGYAGYGTGVQWAILLLGAESSSFAIGKSNGIDPMRGDEPGRGTADIYRVDGLVQDGPLETIGVLNFASDIGIGLGEKVAIAWDADDQAWVAPIECGDAPYGYY